MALQVAAFRQLRTAAIERHSLYPHPNLLTQWGLQVLSADLRAVQT